MQRVLKFVKYIRDYGWQPVVLTAREKDYTLVDPSLVREIPADVKVYRTPAPDLYRGYGRIAGGTGAPVDLSAIQAKEGSTGILSRMALWVRSAFFIPDARMGWFPSAVLAGRKIVMREKIQAIFATSPPFTSALVAGVLGRITGLPWISDYRDPWTQAYFYFKRPGLSRYIEERLEGSLLKGADCIVSVNSRILEGLDHKYGHSSGDRAEVIPNGYDPADFKGLSPVRDDRFTITYTGTLHAQMSPAPLLEAIESLSNESERFRRDIRIRFIGRMGSDIQGLIADSSVKECIEHIPHMSHELSLRNMLGAELLLLLIPQYPGNELHMSGKIFEYLRAGNPVLCLSTRGDAADLVRDTRSGFTVDYGDVQGIREVIRDCYEKWRSGRSCHREKPVKERIEQYDRHLAARKLASLLNRIVATAGSL